MTAEEILRTVEPGADVIVPMANGEPVALLDLLEEHNERLDGVRVHQMHALHARPYIQGEYGERLRHVSYFLSPATREAYWSGGCDLVPNNFSEMPELLRQTTKCTVVMAAASPPNRHGHMSLGTNAEYVARLIGRVPFILEVNAQMPRTFGENQIHVSQTIGCVEVDRPTLQDGIMELVEAGVVTGTYKQIRPNKTVGTFALGTERLYRWLNGNAAIEMLPVDYVNDRASSRGSRTSARSTPRRRSTCTASARRRPSPAGTTPPAVGGPTSPVARCTRRTGRVSWCCTRRHARAARASGRG